MPGRWWTGSRGCGRTAASPGDCQAVRRLKGFVVIPKRWIVERTFGWFNRYRRLRKDYELLPETSEAIIQVTMIHLMVRRLARMTSY